MVTGLGSSYIRPVISLGHQVGRRVFWEWPKFCKLRPIVLNYVQHIFPGREKNFAGGFASLRSPCYGPVIHVSYNYTHGWSIIAWCLRLFFFVISKRSALASSSIWIWFWNKIVGFEKHKSAHLCCRAAESESQGVGGLWVESSESDFYSTSEVQLNNFLHRTPKLGILTRAYWNGTISFGTFIET